MYSDAWKAVNTLFHVADGDVAHTAVTSARENARSIFEIASGAKRGRHRRDHDGPRRVRRRDSQPCFAGLNWG